MEQSFNLETALRVMKNDRGRMEADLSAFECPKVYSALRNNVHDAKNGDSQRVKAEVETHWNRRFEQNRKGTKYSKRIGREDSSSIRATYKGSQN